MNDQKNKFFFHRSIKLGPAIGDWTTIQFQDPSLEEINVSQIRNVNFDSLPREEMQRLHMVHYRLAEEMCKKLSEDMDIKIELHTIMATQLSYEDFLNSQNEKIVQADYVIPEFGRVNVLYDWELADMVVNRLTGGKGEESELETFTDLESTILETQMEELIPLFSDSWRDIFPTDAVDMSFSYGQYQYDQKISLREAYVMFSFYVYFGKGELRRVMWAYPNDVIRSLLSAANRLPNPTIQNIMLKEKTLRTIRVPVHANLGQAVLTMQELSNLQPGDVIPLDTEFDQPILCEIGDDTILPTQIGVVENRLGLQVLPQTESHTYVTPHVADDEVEEVDDFVQDVSLQHPQDVDEDMGDYLPEDVVTSHTAEAPTYAAPGPAPISAADPIDDVMYDEPVAAPAAASEPLVEEDDVFDDDIFGDVDSEEDVYEEPAEQLEAVPAAEQESEDDFDDDFSWDELDDLE